MGDESSRPVVRIAPRTRAGMNCWRDRLPRMTADEFATVAGWATGGIGCVLVVAPRAATGPLGLVGQDGAVRRIGVSDLVLVPGLLRGRPRWPWMLARAALNLAVARYVHRYSVWVAFSGADARRRADACRPVR